MRSNPLAAPKARTPPREVTLRHKAALPKLPLGRIYIVGDLHGALSVLEAALVELRFDIRKDRLVSVGDLIDHGPEGVDSLRLLCKSWFHAFRGNHEALMLEARQGSNVVINLWLRNGRTSLRDCPTVELLELADLVASILLGIERSDRSRIGVIRAEPPIGRDWPSAFRTTQTHQDVCFPSKKRLAGATFWGRRRFQQWRTGEIAGDGLALEHDPGVPGIDLVICGHNIIRSPREQVGNILNLNTGAYEDDGVLTLYNVVTGDFIQTCKGEDSNKIHFRRLQPLASPASPHR